MDTRLLSLVLADADASLRKIQSVTPSSAGSTHEGEAGDATSDSEHCGDDLQDVHPSIGSALHAEGSCKRCCFFPKGRCDNGYACEFCHYEHGARKRTKRKHKKAGLAGHANEDACVDPEEESTSTSSTSSRMVLGSVEIGCLPGSEANHCATEPLLQFAETREGKFQIGDIVCLSKQGCVAPAGYDWEGDALVPGAIGEIALGGNYPHVKGLSGKIDQYWEDDLQHVVPTIDTRKQVVLCERQCSYGAPPGLELQRPCHSDTDVRTGVAPQCRTSESLPFQPDNARNVRVLSVGQLVRLNAEGYLVPDDYCWNDDALCPGQVGEVLVGGVYPLIRGPTGKIDQYWYGHLEASTTNHVSMPFVAFRPPPGLEIAACSHSIFMASSEPR